MEYITFIIAAAWLGILVSISPCPLATNIVTISCLSQQLNRKTKILLQGLAYIIGRTITYVIIAYLIINTLMNAPIVSEFLQTYITRLLGIFLIITGMILLELIKIKFRSLSFTDSIQNKLQNLKYLKATLLGILFALAFCPLSAALYFGSLIPIAIKMQSAFFIPFIFSIFTGIPVIFFAIIIAFATNKIANYYNSFKRIEHYLTKITGIIFILTGIYYILSYIFGIYISLGGIL